MKLSPGGLEKLVEHLQRFVEIKCPTCGSYKWNAIDEVLELLPFWKENVAIKPDKIPVIIVCCADCGYVMMFNALTSGIVETTMSRIETIS